MHMPVLKWVPSPNFSARSAKLDLIVIHDCQGGYAGSINLFTTRTGGRAGPVSAHYVLREDGAEATQMVACDKKAWHCAAFNSRSIGIEMAGFAEKGFSDAEWQGAAEITAYLCLKYHIPVQWAGKGAGKPGICSHYDLGRAGGGHTDPTTDDNLFQKFIARVKALVDAGGVPTDWSPAGAIQPRRKVGYGWKRDIPTFKNTFGLSMPQRSLESHYDLRPGFGECWNQASTSSCVGHATAACFGYIRKQQGLYDWHPSRLFPYWCARAVESATGEDGGAQIHDAFAELVKYGCPPERLWPFDLSLVCTRPNAAAWAEAAKHRAVRHEGVPQTIQALKTAFANKVPVAFGFTVYESFESDEVAETGMMPIPGVKEHVVGGHAVVAVGCDDKQKLLTVRNSWGSRWGDNGYFYMPYQVALDPNVATDFQLVRQIAG